MGGVSDCTTSIPAQPAIMEASPSRIVPRTLIRPGEHPMRPRAAYGSFDETRYRRHQRAKDLAAWHEMLLDRFAGTPEDELLDRLAVSPALAGPQLTFLRARIAERHGDVAHAATLATECLKELPGDQEYLAFAVEVGAALPSRAIQIRAERRRPRL